MKKYKHIVWDWNGTLLDDARLCVDVLNTICKKYGKDPVAFEDYRRNFDFPVQRYYESIGFDFAVDDFELVALDYISEYNRRRYECSLKPGAKQVLERLMGRSVGQSVLSAYAQTMLEEIVEYHKLSSLFERLMGLDDHYAHSKLDNGKKLMTMLETAAADVLLVGDTLHDHATAVAMGVDCVLVADGHQDREKLEQSGAAVLASIEEIAELSL